MARARERLEVGLCTGLTPLVLYLLVWLFARLPFLCLGLGQECIRARGGACVVSLVTINEYNLLMTGTVLGACLPFLFRMSFGRERPSDYVPVMAGTVGVGVAGILSLLLYAMLGMNLYYLDFLSVSTSLLTWGVGAGVGGWLGWRYQKSLDRPRWVQVVATFWVCAFFMLMAVSLNSSTEQERMKRGGALVVEYARFKAEGVALHATDIRYNEELKYFIDRGLTGHRTVPAILLDDGERFWGPTMSSRWMEELAAIVDERPIEEYGEAVRTAYREGVLSQAYYFGEERRGYCVFRNRFDEKARRIQSDYEFCVWGETYYDLDPSGETLRRTMSVEDVRRSGEVALLEGIELDSPSRRHAAKDVALLRDQWRSNPASGGLGPIPGRLRDFSLEEPTGSFELRRLEHMLRITLHEEQSSLKISHGEALEVVFGKIYDTALSRDQRVVSANAARLALEKIGDEKGRRVISDLPLTRYFMGDKAMGYCFYEGELTVNIGENEGSVEANFALKYCHAGRYLYPFDASTETFASPWNLDGLPVIATHPQGYGKWVHARELELLHAFKMGLVAGAISAEEVGMLEMLSTSGLQIDHWFDIMRRVLSQSRETPPSLLGGEQE